MSSRVTLLILVLAAFALFSYGLGVGSLWDEDEARYAQIAADIVKTGDLFTLRENGQPWFDKPPLFMWLQALVGRLFGFTEFTARIWSAVSGAVAVAATYLLARLFYDSRTALLAGAILATTFQFFAMSRLAILDAMLVAFMLLALYMFLVGYANGSRRAYLWAWTWAGLATAAKTPIGLLLPGLVIAALWTLRGEWGRWREIPLMGPVLFAIVGLTWYAVEAVRHGDVFLHAAVGQHLISRFFGAIRNQSGPWWYYIPVLVAGAFPWAGFIPSTVVFHVRRRHELASQVILLWTGVTLVFYSAAGTKLPNYILPVYPFLAIGIARLCVEALEGTSGDAPRLVRLAYGLLPVGVAIFVAGIVVLGLQRYSAEAAVLRGPLILIAAAFVAGPMAALVFYRARRPAAALGALMLTLVVATPVLVHDTLPAVERQRSVPRIGRGLRDAMRPGDALVAVAMSPFFPSLSFYARRPVIWVEDPRGLAEALCRHDRLFLVVPDEQYQAWVAALLQPDVRQEGRDGRYRVLLKEGPAPCAAHTGSLLGLTAPRRAAGEFLVALGISTLKADFAIK